MRGINTGTWRLLILVLLILAPPRPGLAHRVNLFALVEGGVIRGEGYFPGGAKCINCRVEMLSPAGVALKEVKTDARGRFSLGPPLAPLPLTVVIHAGQGHRNKFLLRPVAGTREAKAAPGAVGAQSRCYTQKEVDELIAQRVAARQDEVGAKEITAGLGWILGIFGAAAFLLARRKSQRVRAVQGNDPQD